MPYYIFHLTKKGYSAIKNGYVAWNVLFDQPVKKTTRKVYPDEEIRKLPEGDELLILELNKTDLTQFRRLADQWINRASKTDPSQWVKSLSYERNNLSVIIEKPAIKALFSPQGLYVGKFQQEGFTKFKKPERNQQLEGKKRKPSLTMSVEHTNTLERLYSHQPTTLDFPTEEIGDADGGEEVDALPSDAMVFYITRDQKCRIMYEKDFMYHRAVNAVNPENSFFIDPILTYEVNFDSVFKVSGSEVQVYLAFAKIREDKKIEPSPKHADPAERARVALISSLPSAPQKEATLSAFPNEIKPPAPYVSILAPKAPLSLPLSEHKNENECKQLILFRNKFQHVFDDKTPGKKLNFDFTDKDDANKWYGFIRKKLEEGGDLSLKEVKVTQPSPGSSLYRFSLSQEQRQLILVLIKSYPQQPSVSDYKKFTLVGNLGDPLGVDKLPPPYNPSSLPSDGYRKGR